MLVTNYSINNPYRSFYVKQNGNPHFYGIGAYVNKALNKTIQISKHRRYPLSEELNTSAKFVNLKNNNMSTEVLEINPYNFDRYIVFFHGIGQNVTSNERIYKSI